MRKINLSTYVTLDGAFEDPGGAEEFEHGGWSNPFFNDEAAKYARDQLWSSDGLLLGRKTYEEFAASWPNMEETEGDFAVRMNTLPKFVASNTLAEPLDWSNSSLIEGDVAEGVSKLKDETGQDLLMYSSSGLMHTLMGHGLIDEFRLWVHPVVLGGGRRLFPDGIRRTDMKLVDATTLSTGVVILAYERAG
jgi:dihydrofolate reductase